MSMIYTDCTTKDIEAVQPVANRLMIAFQAMQAEATRDMDPRDQMIVIVSSLTQLLGVAERVTKKTSTPRFLRTIKAAVKVARAFGTGQLDFPNK